MHLHDAISAEICYLFIEALDMKMDSKVLPIVLPKYKQLYAYNIDIIGHSLHLQQVNFVRDYDAITLCWRFVADIKMYRAALQKLDRLCIYSIYTIGY